MKLSEIIVAVNELIDDQLPVNTIARWVNDGIAKLNTECATSFPFLDITTDTSPVFPEKWQRLLLVKYAAAMAKQQDSSQFEYMDLYSQFDEELENFKSKYNIPDGYKELVEQDLLLPDGTTYSASYGETLQEIATAKATTVQAIKDSNKTIYFSSSSSYGADFTGSMFGGDW